MKKSGDHLAKWFSQKRLTSKTRSLLKLGNFIKFKGQAESHFSTNIMMSSLKGNCGVTTVLGYTGSYTLSHLPMKIYHRFHVSQKESHACTFMTSRSALLDLACT